MVVEDNALNRRLTKAHLDRLGHRVEFAGDGREAVERVRAESFDVVLMDVRMPEMDGLTATRLIRAGGGGRGNGARLPIIALTADTMNEDQAANACGRGWTFIWSSPWTPGAFRGALRRVMG